MAASKKPPYVKTFSCPSCGGTVNIRAIGSSLNVVCSYCSSIIDTTNENYIVIETFTNKIKRRQVIDLGDRGNISGTVWENVGYMERCDQSGRYVWSEYLLFNPIHGYRWLTEYGGHWSFVKSIKDKPRLEKVFQHTILKYHGNSYSLFNKGTARVTFVLGEFYWQVRIGEKVDLIEFISPPEIISIERSENEIQWSMGIYIPAETIKNAFNITKTMPRQSGIAPNQPSPYTEETKAKISKIWKFFLLTLTIIQLGYFILPSSETVFSGNFEFRNTDITKTKVSPQFEIKEKDTNLKFNFHSPLNDSWLDIQVELVNDEDGESVEFEEGIEYYSGYDSDGHWSEGSESTEKMITGIPKGKYHLNLEVTGPTLIREENFIPADPSWQADVPPVVLAVEVKTGATIWSNYIFSLILISVFPIILFWRRHSFESERWSESDFSPYNTEEED